MENDFNRWNGRKAHLDSLIERPYFQKREVWWAALGQNIGSEENGKGAAFRRPVLVFRKFNTELLWAIPLSSKIKKNNPYYETILSEDGIERSAIISQLGPIDAKRLIKKIGIVSKEDFEKIRKSVIDLC